MYNYAVLAMAALRTCVPLPRSLPLAHADQILGPDGAMVAESDFARKVAQFMPWSLRKLVRYAAALRPLRERRTVNSFGGKALRNVRLMLGLRN